MKNHFCFGNNSEECDCPSCKSHEQDLLQKEQDLLQKSISEKISAKVNDPNSDIQIAIRRQKEILKKQGKIN